MRSALACLLLGLASAFAAEAPLKFNDPKPQGYQLRARASELDKPGFGVELNRDIALHRPYPN